MGVGKFLDELKQSEQDTPTSTDISKSVNKPDSKSVSPTHSTEPRDIVSLTVKVDRQLRQHWQVEAKKRGTTVSQIVVDALKETLGQP